MLTIKVVHVQRQVYFMPVSPMARALARRVGALILTAEQLSDEARRLDTEVTVVSGNCVEAGRLLAEQFCA